jgi:hypothetical protein
VPGAERQRSSDDLLARALVPIFRPFDEASDDRHAPDQLTGLLDRVPGWVVLVGLATLALLGVTLLRP